TRDEMNLMVEQIWLETRKTIVFITHNIGEAVFLSDRVFVMSPRPGRLARTFEVPYARPRTLDVMAERSFFDMVNEIKAEIRRSIPLDDKVAKQDAAKERTVRAHG